MPEQEIIVTHPAVVPTNPEKTADDIADSMADLFGSGQSRYASYQCGFKQKSHSLIVFDGEKRNKLQLSIEPSHDATVIVIYPYKNCKLSSIMDIIYHLGDNVIAPKDAGKIVNFNGEYIVSGLGTCKMVVPEHGKTEKTDNSFDAKL